MEVAYHPAFAETLDILPDSIFYTHAPYVPTFVERDQGAPVDASVVWSDFLIFIPSLCACVHWGDDWRNVFFSLPQTEIQLQSSLRQAVRVH